MAINQTNRLLEYVRSSVLYDGAGRTDRQLLDSFAHHKDEAALAALMRRHAPMVWGVCCRMLRSYHDAEDAFQAVFLVLVQKAATLPDKETVGNWLYGVAQQTAVRMRALAAKRGVREKQVAVMPEPTSAEQYVWNDLKLVLDEELRRLPDKYRVVIVLCDLEDRTRKEVARQLAIPEGTVASRLATARAMLAKRLAGRGVVASVGLLATVLAQQAASVCVPGTMVSSTIKAATLVASGQGLAGAISPTVSSLIKGVTKTMLVSKIKVVLAVVLVVGLALGGGEVGVGLFPDPTASAQQSGSGPGGDNSQTDSKEKPQSAPKVVQIRIDEPRGMNVSLWPELGNKDRVVPVEAPGRLTLEQGKRSRLKLSGIPNRPGVELFPTVEIPADLFATAESFVTSSAIPIDFSDEDFSHVIAKWTITKVVYLASATKGRIAESQPMGPMGMGGAAPPAGPMADAPRLTGAIAGAPGGMPGPGSGMMARAGSGKPGMALGGSRSGMGPPTPGGSGMGAPMSSGPRPGMGPPMPGGPGGPRPLKSESVRASGRVCTIASYDYPHRDVIEVARQRGTVLAVLRMGDIRLSNVGRPPQIVIGDDGIQGRVERLEKGRPSQAKANDDRVSQLVNQLERLMRDVDVVQVENQKMRQQVKASQLEIRSLQTSLANKDMELTKLKRELKRATDKK